MAESRARLPLFSDSVAASLPSPLAPVPTDRSTSPLFPSSPPSGLPSPLEADTATSATTSASQSDQLTSIRPTIMERRASRSKREPLDSTSLLLAPSSSAATLKAETSSLQSARSSAHSPSESTSASMQRLPSNISLADAPHLVPKDTLAALPTEQLIALVMALSENRDALKMRLEASENECGALETVCRDAGVGRGEIDRAKVRARAEPTPHSSTLGKGARKEWRIALIPSVDVIEDTPLPAREEEEDAPIIVSDVELDLDNLADAMSDQNAFDLPTSPAIGATTVDDPSLAVSTSPIEFKTPATSVGKSGSSKQSTRARHASLSSRLFGSFSLGSSSSSSSPPAVPSVLSTSPPSTPNATSLFSKPNRHKRSGSIKSTSSIASANSSIASGDPSFATGKDDSNAAPYAEWIGWKNWRGPKEKKSALASSVVEHDSTPSSSNNTSDDERDPRANDELAKTIVASGQSFDGDDTTTTPMPKSARVSDFFDPSIPAMDESSMTMTSADNSPSKGVDPPIQPESASSIPPPSPPAASLLSQMTSTTEDSSEEPSMSSPSPSVISPASSSTLDSSKRRVPGEPSSPILTRARLPSAPLISTQQAQGSSILPTEARASLSRTSSLSSRRPSTTRTSETGGESTPVINETKDPETTSKGWGAQTETTTADSAVTLSSVEALESGLPAKTDGGVAFEKPSGEQQAIKSRRRVSASASQRKPPVAHLMTLSSKDTLSASTSPSSTLSASKDGYVASAKGVFGRALGFGSSPSSPKMTRSHSDEIRKSNSTTEPNLTLFPKLANISKYSPFAPAALSTPATSVSLSAHSSPIVQHTPIASTATIAASIPPTSMELGVISGEATPPTLALHNPVSGQAAGEGEEGPMVDRYGFVYDVRSGMKLLREARKRQERAAGVINGNKKGHTDMVDDSEEDDIKRNGSPQNTEVTPAGEVMQTQAELDAELEGLREALGIPPPSASSSSATPISPRSPIPNHSSTLTANGATRPTQLTRSASSDRPSAPTVASTSSSTGPQSMKRLLTQLKEMSDVQDQKRKLEWDAFIAKRQTKLTKLASTGLNGSMSAGLMLDGHHDGKESSHVAGGSGKKRAPRAVIVESTKVNAFSNEDDDDLDTSGDYVDGPAWRSEDLVGVSQMGVDGKSGKEDWAEFKELVRRGVPIAYRPKIWAECSGANEAREPGVYHDLLAEHKSEENQCLNQIDMDCHRTFPTNVFFAGTGPGVAKLRNVLVAYSWRNPQIGYCQGMNNLTATLLLTHPAEEDAFWVLVCIIEKILPSDYYTSHLLVSQADQRVLKDLVLKLMPDVAEHLEELGVELPAISFGWFLSLFTDTLPIQTLLRVWDLIFVFGTVMLFRVAIAILKLHRTEILGCDSAASLYALMRAMTNHLYQVDKLLKIACDELKPLIKDKDVSQLRMKHVRELQTELGL